MISITCVRCGRERTAEETESTPRGEQPWGSLLEEGVWARFSDGDVCPDCQSADERSGVGHRIATAIEDEIRRRDAAGENPDRFEEPLVHLAMDTRAGGSDPTSDEANAGLPGPHPRRGGQGIDSTSTSGPSAQAHVKDVGATRYSQLQVAITGAFLTGSSVHVHPLTYSEAQTALAKTLRSPTWSVRDLATRHGTFQSGGGFTTAAPLIIARRNGADLMALLSAAAKEARRTADQLNGPTDSPVALAPNDVRIDVYDLGVGVLTAWFDVDLGERANLPLEHAAAAVKRMVLLRADSGTMPPLSIALQRIASGVAADYADAVANLPQTSELPADQQPPASQPERISLATGRTDEDGRLLWLHPINVLTAVEPADATERLAPRFCQLLDVHGGRFAAGVGWSALVVASPDSDEQAVPIAITELHWAYFALYMEIDRGLLNILDHPRWNKPLTLAELERDADAVFADYLWVMTARARLDSALAARGGDELAIWEAIAKAQRFDTVVQSVERKLDVLEDLAKRRVDQANAYRARRTADGLGSLNVLTLVTVTVAVIGAIFGSRSSGLNSLWVRIPLIVVAVLLAGILYWLVFVRTSRWPRPRSRQQRRLVKRR